MGDRDVVILVGRLVRPQGETKICVRCGMDLPSSRFNPGGTLSSRRATRFPYYCLDCRGWAPEMEGVDR